MLAPTQALIDFHRHFCPDATIDSPIVVIRLLEELTKKDKERKDNEKQD